MTDEELRIKVAELLGWTNIRIVGLNKIPKGTPPGHKETDEWVIPCYPEYIAMAWELIDFLADIGDRHIMVRFDALRTDDENNPNWTIHISPDIRFDVDRKDVPRAITKAFIMAMENE